jgi:Ferritin-like domain
MIGRADESARGNWTRGQVLRAGLAGAATAGLMGLAQRHDTEASAAAPSARMDAEILQAFLELEYAQQRYYAAALHSARLTGELRRLAEILVAQETRHIAVLEQHLGPRARPPAALVDAQVVTSPEAFRTRAIALEEGVIAAYIGQGANLTRRSIAAITPIVSVEARQVAWLRDLAGVNPAPRAADPARPMQDVVGELRQKGLIR